MSGCGNTVVVAGGGFRSLHTFKTTILSPVGGEVIAFNGLMLLALYLAVMVAGTVAAGVLLRRRMP